jgi:PRTRC genetic system protein A
MWDNGPRRMWRLAIPEQERSATSCKPIGAAVAPGGSYEKAVIEVHSHHSMSAFFSSTDDKDEQGFRIYGVLGTIFDRPTLRLRIGVYGQFWEVPAEDFFELGEPGKEPAIQDAYFDEAKAVEENEEVLA